MRRERETPRTPKAPVINEVVRREIRGMFGEQYRMLEKLMHGPGELTFIEAREHPQTQELQFKHGLRIAAIAERSGWPGPTMVGYEATGCLGLILENARQFPELQERLLPFMEQALFAGELEPDLYATYLDDVMLRTGVGQVYGTSMTRGDDGRYSLQLPVADIAHLDQRRAEIMLPPVSAELAALNSPEYEAHLELANTRSPWKQADAPARSPRKGARTRSKG